MVATKKTASGFDLDRWHDLGARISTAARYVLDQLQKSEYQDSRFYIAGDPVSSTSTEFDRINGWKSVRIYLVPKGDKDNIKVYEDDNFGRKLVQFNEGRWVQYLTTIKRHFELVAEAETKKLWEPVDDSELFSDISRPEVPKSRSIFCHR